MHKTNAVYEKFIDGRMRIMGSGADREWVEEVVTPKGWVPEESKKPKQFTQEQWDKINAVSDAQVAYAKAYTDHEVHQKAHLEMQDALKKEKSDGATASYYELPDGASELQDLISDRNMNAQIGEIFRECYRYGRASHSDEMRGIKKILFYAKAELERLQKLEK